MELIDGKKIAKRILEVVKKEIKKCPVIPGLGVVLVGNDAPSEIYVGAKEKKSHELGIHFQLAKLPEQASHKEILTAVERFNKDKSIHGIVVQLPLPRHINAGEIIGAIDPRKDVDGIHPENIKLFSEKKERWWPVFPKAIIEAIITSGKPLIGKSAVVIANSQEFGKLMRIALGRYEIKAEHIPCDISDSNIKKIQSADIVLTACGKENLLSSEEIKDGAIVVDGGIIRHDGKIVGDINKRSFSNKNVKLSPVPGGVGPVTVACLLSNIVQSAKNFG